MAASDALSMKVDISGPKSDDEEEEGEILSDEDDTPTPQAAAPATADTTAKDTPNHNDPPPILPPPNMMTPNQGLTQDNHEKKKPAFSIGDIAEKIQQRMMMTSQMISAGGGNGGGAGGINGRREKMDPDEDDRGSRRKRHHKKEKRKRKNSHSSDDHSPSRKHLKENSDVIVSTRKVLLATPTPEEIEERLKLFECLDIAIKLAAIQESKKYHSIGDMKKRRHDRKRSRSRSRSPSRKSKKEDINRICKYYQEGKCFKDNCPYSHNCEQFRRTDLCRFYVGGNCVKRDCPYMHDDFPCKFFHTGAPCFADKKCRYSHAPLTDEMREILQRYLAECKGLNRDDLEKLRMKARDDRPMLGIGRHGGPVVLDRHMMGGDKEKDKDSFDASSAPFGSIGDVDLRLPPPSMSEDVDYRSVIGGASGTDQDYRREGTPPRNAPFYKDTLDSPKDRSPTKRRGSDSSMESRSRRDEDNRYSDTKVVIERPSDPRAAREDHDMYDRTPPRRDSISRLQIVEDENSGEEGGHTPVAEDDNDGGRTPVRRDSEDDPPVTNALKNPQDPIKECAVPPLVPPVPPPAEFVKMISSITNNPQPNSSLANHTPEYWKQLLSIAGVPSGGLPGAPPLTPTANAPTMLGVPAKVDPRLSRDPRQAAASALASTLGSGGMTPPRSSTESTTNVLPIFPKLAVTAVIESKDGDAPYNLKSMEPSIVNYAELVYLTEVNFQLKADPRLAKHLDKKKKEEVSDTPQSPPPMHSPFPQSSTLANQLPGNRPVGKAPLLPLPQVPPVVNDPRSKQDPRLQRGDPRGQFMNPASSSQIFDGVPPGLGAASPYNNMGDLRTQGGVMPPVGPRMTTSSDAVGNGDIRMGGNDPRVAGAGPRIGGDPRIGGADPRVGMGGLNARMGANDPRMGANDPRMGSNDPRMGGGNPRMGPGDPRAAAGDPRMGGCDPRSGNPNIPPLGLPGNMRMPHGGPGPLSMDPRNLNNNRPPLVPPMDSYTARMGVPHHGNMMGDPRMGFGGPRLNMDPRQGNRMMDSRNQHFDPRTGNESQRPDPRSGFGSGPTNTSAPSGPGASEEAFSDPRQKPVQRDPRAGVAKDSQKRDPRSTSKTEVTSPTGPEEPDEAVEKTSLLPPKTINTQSMTYNSPLGVYEEAPKTEDSYQRRPNVGRIKKKSPAAVVEPATQEQPTTVPEENKMADPLSVSLPPPPALLSHPVDPFASSESKPLSEVFKTKDPTASPFM